MTLTRIRQALNLLDKQARLIESQQKLIDLQANELNRAKLGHYREMQGLVSSWLIHCETPEVDMRDTLATFEVSIANRIAILEEHIA